MGADLVGYLVKGPAEINDLGKRDVAVKRVFRILEICAKYNEWAKEAKNDEDYDFSELEELVEFGYPDDAYDFADRHVATMPTEESAGEIVDEFMDNWPPDFRDSVVRLDPDDATQVFVFCGDQTWGDEPEGGGYDLVKDGFQYGLCEIFGIR